MRIIVERDDTSRWQACWADRPEESFVSAGIFGAVAKLLIHSGDERGVSPEDFQLDFNVSGGDHMEMFLKPQRTEKLTRSFIARDEEGTEHTLHVFATIERVANQRVFSEREVSTRLVTDDGLAVFRLEKGRYEMIGVPPVILTSDDPDAP